MTSADRRGLTLWHVVATLPWIVAVLVARSSIGDNSFLWHVTAGRLQNARGVVLTEDPFSLILEGAAWRTQSWLADIGYAWFDERVQLAFVPWLRFAAALILFVLIALTAWKITRSVAAVASVSFLTALLAVPYLNPRPVLFSYVIMAAVVLVERTPRLRWTLPALFYLWASVHGSWVIGAAYLALSVLEHREYRRVRTEAPFIALATLVTAHGWGVFDYLLAFSRNSKALSLITEWAPPDLTSVARLPFTLGLILLMLGAARGAISTRQIVFAAPVILFALSSSRSVLPGFLLLTPLLAAAITSLAEATFTTSLKGVRVVLLGVLILPLLLPVDGGLSESRFPVGLIRQAEGTRLFHDDVVGGYLIYAEWPEIPVLIDDRAELYGPELTRFVSARAGREGWRSYFDEHDLNAALLQADQPLVELLRNDGWTETVDVQAREDGWVLLLAK